MAPAADTGDDAPGLATLLVLAGGGGGDTAAGAPAGDPAGDPAAVVAPAAVNQKKRKPKFSPNPHEDPVRCCPL